MLCFVLISLPLFKYLKIRGGSIDVSKIRRGNIKKGSLNRTPCSVDSCLVCCEVAEYLSVFKRALYWRFLWLLVVEVQVSVLISRLIPLIQFLTFTSFPILTLALFLKGQKFAKENSRKRVEFAEIALRKHLMAKIWI